MWLSQLVFVEGGDPVPADEEIESAVELGMARGIMHCAGSLNELSVLMYSKSATKLFLDKDNVS